MRKIHSVRFGPHEIGQAKDFSVNGNVVTVWAHHLLFERKVLPLVIVVQMGHELETRRWERATMASMGLKWGEYDMNEYMFEVEDA